MTTALLPAPRTAPKVVGMPTAGIMLVVGHPKSGKSWFAASAPASVVVELEPHGADRIPHGRILELDTSTEDALTKFDEAMQAVMADNGTRVVVIDTVDQWAKLVQDDIAKRAGIKFIGEPVKGVDSRALWGEFGQAVHAIIDALRDCGKLVVLVAHCKPPEKDADGRVITPAGINVSGKGGAYIAAMAETIGFVGVRVLGGKAQHYITFRAPSDLAIWRSRVDELQEKELILDRKDPWGSLMAAFSPVVKPEIKKKEAKK